MDDDEKRSFKHVDYWIDLCNDEINAAQLLLKNKHYLLCGFLCHLITERALKAYCCYVDNEENIPAKTHHLQKLIELAGLKDVLSAEQWDFIEFVNPLNIEARYPKYKERVHKLLSAHGVCERLFSQTEEFLSWIKNKLLK
ncbi:MAG: HEPN domain-containing protein [Chitinispirillia bacterium]|nr:HEPN domain-containing protein [Chitinispirillia bacterium]